MAAIAASCHSAPISAPIASRRQWCLLRPPEEEVLPELGPEVDERADVIALFDALGDHHCAQGFGHFDQASQRVIAVAATIAADARHPPAVDLDHLGLEQHEMLERRLPEADIVDAEAQAGPPQTGGRFAQRRRGTEQLLL